LRNLAVEKGYMPPVFKELGSSILQSGYAYRIPDLRIKKRAELGLPPLPMGKPDELAKLAEVVGFKRLLEKAGRS